MKIDRPLIVGLTIQALGSAGIIYPVIANDLRLRGIEKERIQLSLESLPQGQIVRPYDKNRNGDLETTESRALFNDYELKPRESPE